MNDPAAIAPEAPVVQLGIRGLEQLTNSMIDGGLYVLVAETPSARFPLLANSLGGALKEGLNCTVIVPSNPESFLQRIESFDRSITQDLVTSKRLQLFEMQDDFAKTMFRYGAEGFVKELDYFEIPEHSYLIFDQSDELLSLHDISLAMDQVDILGKWLHQRQITALLSFSRVSEDDASTINALMDNLTGIARLGGGRDGLELTFDYWQSPDGTVAAKSYHLTALDSGLYEASSQNAASDQGTGEEIEPAPEEADADRHFFYMDPDLGSVAKVTPGIWQRVDTLLGMMHATRSSRTATAILRFQTDTNLRQLAEAVHTLRLGMGRRAHIVVQEKNASLRYQNESLLLRLGVNLIVHKDVATSRMPLMLESLKGQIFSRDVNIDFEEALNSVTPSPLRGYLLPARFAREVNVILERAGPLNIPYAMIIGQPAAETTMVDVLKRIKLTRTGDLFTADSNVCYIFLNACPQTVLLATVTRIFGGSIETSLAKPRFLTQRAEVDLELTTLAVAAERGGLPDYSARIESTPDGDAAKTHGSDAKPVPMPAPVSAAIPAPLAVTTPTPLTKSDAAPPAHSAPQSAPSSQAPSIRPAAPAPIASPGPAPTPPTVVKQAAPTASNTVFAAALASTVSAPAATPAPPPATLLAATLAAAPASLSTHQPAPSTHAVSATTGIASEAPQPNPPTPAVADPAMAPLRAKRAIGPPAALPTVPQAFVIESPAVAVFGKKEAPRATRSAAPANAPTPSANKPPDP